MSVRKRIWFTNLQLKKIEPKAKEIATIKGKRGDWKKCINRAAELLGSQPQEAWVVDYLLNGKRHIETFDRKRDAEAHHDKVRSDIRKGTYVPPSKSPTLAEAAQKWLSQCTANGLERATLRQYREHANLHIAPRIGRIRLAKLTPANVENFRDQLFGQGNGNGNGAENGAKNGTENGAAGTEQVEQPTLSPATARKVWTSFKSILKVAGYSHVAVNVEIKRRKRKLALEEGRDFPDMDEIKRLVNAAKKPRLRALLLMAALTGLRASELRGLRWKDVDLENGVLEVRQRADEFNQIGPPKSEAGKRHVPLPPELIEALKRWKLACPKGKARGEDRLVFPTSTGKVQDYNGMMGSLASLMLKAGVVDDNGEPKYGMHGFRHFFASWCINPKDRGGRELAPKQVQKQLGHSSIVMTLDIYGHLFRDTGDRQELAAATSLLLGTDVAPSANVVALNQAAPKRTRKASQRASTEQT